MLAFAYIFKNTVQDIGRSDVLSDVMSTTHNQCALKRVEFCLYVHKGAFSKKENAYVQVIGIFSWEGHVIECKCPLILNHLTSIAFRDYYMLLSINALDVKGPIHGKSDIEL